MVDQTRSTFREQIQSETNMAEHEKNKVKNVRKAAEEST
uniref:Uncharacterized protein n=1 Tax=Rhizophora mucronata TaxID=61149 RepID=A0A2P2PW07_RHIMU